jgi:hypothetical protein
MSGVERGICCNNLKYEKLLQQRCGPERIDGKEAIAEYT